MTRRSLLVLAVIVGGCGGTSSENARSGDVAAGGGSGKGTGGVTSTGSASATGGMTMTGGNSASGGASATSGAFGGGGGGDTGGAVGGGGSPAGDPDAAVDLRPDLSAGTGGGFGTGGTAGGSGGFASGGAGGTGGSAPDAGRDGAANGKPDAQHDATGAGGADASPFTKPVAVPDGGACPYTGHVTYTLTKSANPTADEQSAYAKIAAAMDQAIAYYNCYTNVSKAVKVEYVSSVATADGNSNGTIRFGSDTSYMVLRVAMHEISHVLGVGTASNWRSFVDIPSGAGSGPWTGANGIAQRAALLPDAWEATQKVLTADTQHFWPYGLNLPSDYKSEADLLGHCAMVMAIRKDLGLQ